MKQSRRGNERDKMRAEERRIKMFVQHHLTLDSAEHRNSDSLVRERRFSIPREPIPSLSECKEWTARLRKKRMRDRRLRLVMPDAKFYEHDAPFIFRDDGRRRFPAFFFCSLWQSSSFFILILSSSHSLFPFLCTFRGRADFNRNGSLVNVSATSNMNT